MTSRLFTFLRELENEFQIGQIYLNHQFCTRMVVYNSDKCKVI